MFGVFIHREDSRYDDHPSERYQFPSSYLSRAMQFERGWVLFYEPTKVRESRGYYAVGRIEKIVPDPSQSAMYLALIEPGSYFEFSQNVPFKNDGTLMERGLYNDAGNISGRAQAAVRPISESDFNRVLDAGLSDLDAPLPRVDQADSASLYVEEGQAAFEYEVSRERQVLSGSRAIRSPIFRKLVLNAYDERCAFTGLKFINGGGRAEVEAAHIRAVEHQGPDSVQNGIALSGTVHWMFDRGLLSLADDMEIMVSRHVNDIDSVEKLIHKSFIATSPNNERNAPHPAFLKWHRDNCFKV